MSNETGGQENVPLKMDDIVKMLFTLSDELTVRMINSLFKKNLPLNAKVIVESNELRKFSYDKHGVEGIRVDMLLSINGERFHAEFQTVNDKAITVRMFEYGFSIAIKEVKSYLTDTDDGLMMNYPSQYVIFVERDGNIPEHELTMKVKLWDGDIKEYKVPLMRYWEETPDSLERKHLEPLLPLQVFNIRRDLERIARSKKPESEKEKLTEAKLREVIEIYKTVSEKIRDLTDKEGRLTTYHAEQMLRALQHLSAYLYYNYKGYNEIEKEAVQVSEAVWSFDKWRNEGELKRSKETAHEMFVDGESITKIRKYSKLSDKELADVLRTLPKEIQTSYANLNQ